MRNVVHAARVLILAVLLGAGLPLGMAAAAEQTRVIVTPDADYPGFDYQTVKNVDLKACEAACIDGAECRAFTYNQKARWCFLKTDFGTLTATLGATAGRLVSTPELTPSLEATRLADLDFVPGRYVDEARELAGTIKRRFPPPEGAAYQMLRDQGTDAYNARNYDGAATLFGQTLSIADDNPGLWLDFAIASLARDPDDWSMRQQANQDVTAASINGLVRSDSIDNQARALALLGDGFAHREDWKLSYRSYRASLALVEDPTVRDDYERVIAEHGFRIVSHSVDADLADPRICVVFSDDLPVSDPRLADFVTVSGGEGLAIEPERRQICIDGVKHGGRYDLRIRGGLPAADGEVLPGPVELNVYVRDRAPWVGFAGNAYVLPSGPGASIPIVSVNTDKALAQIFRIGDRGVAFAVRNNQFMRTLSQWSAENIGYESGEKVWEGEILIQSELNKTITTAVPVTDAIPDLKPGVYVITAKAELSTDEWGQLATQWFVVSDLGLTALSGSDGIHAIVRSLSTAEPVAGATIRLVAVNNDVLGEAVTDANGYVRFDPGLARGAGGAAPQMIDATAGAGDYAFIDLTRAAFDLADRGVEGRPAPGPLDVFITPERGIYRPGETVHLTALVRDARADAVGDLPLTLVVERPDGVEYLRETLSDGGLGGYSANVALIEDAMRGSWQVRLYADPKGAAIAETSVLVEDFQPERLAFDLVTQSKAIGPGDPAIIDLTARYLYGATAPGLSIDGDIDIRAAAGLPGFAGYNFGLADDRVDPWREPIDLGAFTDEEGNATLQVDLPQLPATTRPLEAQIIVRIADTNGRAVERRLTLPVTPEMPMIGIKPQFDGDEVEEGATANLDVIVVDPAGQRIDASGLTWRLERILSDYQWYRNDGGWNYEVVTSAERVATGEIDAKADGPVTVSANVDWGRYRLTVERLGDEAAASSYEFYAGWYVSSVSSQTPDVLDVALDKPAYRVGDTAKLRLDPRFAGIAVVTVVDDRLITMKAVDVPEGGTSVDLEVTDQWGPGAYVTATLFRPMDVPAKRMPSRALGLTWAKVEPGDRDLAVSLDVVDEMRPRQPMTIPVAIDNLKPGDRAYVTVAAVDLGILNLTNFQPPAPDDWYFGQRKLGMEIRDLYGLLIDRMQGVPGQIRTGGDGGGIRLAAPPPTEKLVAFYSGIVEVGPDGKATVSFDMPQFNGTVRVMAMAWSRTGIGHAVKDVLVRDPVVLSASIPQFLNTDDSSRLLVEINNVSGPAGDYGLKVEAGDGIGIAASDLMRTVTLAEKERQSFNIPISGEKVGDFTVTVTLSTPSGEAWPRELALGIRPPGQPVSRRNVVALNGGATLTVDAAPLAEFVPGTASVAVSIGGASRLDVAGILAALDRYPYGCAEQLTSRALPLVYLNDVAIAVGAATDAEIGPRVQKAIQGVLANQSSSGSFGLWGPYGDSNLWLDSYVTDFLTRAAEKGYDVPELSRTLALDNLSNRLSYADDFQNGGEDVAYALYVLARTGRASLGDLRYYAETKIGNFGTALAKAQVGAALALYGDRARASRAFEAAFADLRTGRNADIWVGDYGSQLRDKAAVLTLAAESDVGGVDLRDLANQVATEEELRRYTSTQEQAWMLLAAAALIEDSARTQFEIEGAAVAGPLYKDYSQAVLEAAPVAIKNLGTDTLDAVLTTTGVTVVPEPAGGTGFSIERTYYTVDGEPTDIAAVGQNERIVVMLTVTADQARSGNLLVVDPIPAGYEIENPNISASGDVSSFGWLAVERNVAHTEARTDRFVAALNRTSDDSLQFSVAYSMRAVSPGVFAQPAATVEDMYRPYLNARTDTGSVEVVGPTR